MDYESDNGFATKVWGPILWTFLHIVSFNYPVRPTSQDQMNYYMFMIALGNVLPCGKCRDNYSENLRNLQFSLNDLRDRASFSNFVYRLHVHVTKLTNGSFRVPFLELRDNFELFRAQCNNGPGHKGCVSTTCRLVQRVYQPKSKEAQNAFLIQDACRRKRFMGAPEPPEVLESLKEKS